MITIRSARETDLPDILEIYNHVILNTTAVYTYEPHTLDMRREWYDGKVRDGYPVFVAEEAGRVIGLSTYGPFRAWPAYKYSVENSVYVAADQRA
jgi:L-amino acid N-acyltransferase YncA